MKYEGFDQLNPGALTRSTQGERSLSNYWRESTDDRVLELISVLHGTQNLIGLMGSYLRVRWSGDGGSYTDFYGHVVSLDYGPLAGCKAPFPGGAVDEVIGYAAHEGGIACSPGKAKTRCWPPR